MSSLTRKALVPALLGLLTLIAIPIVIRPFMWGWLRVMARPFEQGMELDHFEAILKEKGYTDQSIATMRISDSAILIGQDHPYAGPPCYLLRNRVADFDYSGMSVFSPAAGLVISFDESKKIRYVGEVKGELEAWGCGVPAGW